MPGAVETAIRAAITHGLTRVAQFNRKRARAIPGAHPYLTGLHRPLDREITLEQLSVSGTIPPDLNGMYVRIGPNPVGNPNPARYHWFTGDGMVHALRIAQGQALWYRNRWVRTSTVSQALGEAPAPGPRLAEMAVNTNIIAHGGAFWALVEAGGTPVRLDHHLATIAHDPFGGTLAGAFSAHPHRDPASGELHAICYHASQLDRVHHVVVDPAGRVRRAEPIAVHHGPSIHDCALTARFVLVFDLPVTFSMPAMLAGYEFPYRWNPDHPARVGLLAREGRGADIIWCDVDPCYVYHPANAYDLADGRVVVDLSVHGRNSYRDFRGPDGEQIRLERWTIDPATRQISRTVIDDVAVEFPRIDERRISQPHRYIYSLCVPTGGALGGADSRIVKHDTQAGTRAFHDFGAGQAPGEFLFIPRDPAAGEDEGWLMGFVVDMSTDSTSLAILDARDIASPPVARVHIPHRIPPGFHGNWVGADAKEGLLG